MRLASMAESLLGRTLGMDLLRTKRTLRCNRAVDEIVCKKQSLYGAPKSRYDLCAIAGAHSPKLLPKNKTIKRSPPPPPMKSPACVALSWISQSFGAWCTLTPKQNHNTHTQKTVTKWDPAAARDIAQQLPMAARTGGVILRSVAVPMALALAFDVGGKFARDTSYGGPKHERI